MSKQSEAKREQGYREAPDTCATCGHYKSQMVEKTYDAWNGKQVWNEEKGKRCSIGGFSVKKMATCDRHVLAPEAEAMPLPLRLSGGVRPCGRSERTVMSEELQMWAINVEGTDGLVAAPTKAEADAACTLLNAAFGRNKGLHDMGVKAVVVPWTLGYEQWRASYETEFRDLLMADLVI